MDHAKLVYYVSRCKHASGGGQWCSKCNLHTAADQGDVESVARLLAAGADANYPIQVVVVGWTQGSPLHWAAEFHTGHSTEEKSIAIIQLLIAHGAEVNFQNVNGQTPLHLAVACGHLAVANCLIQNGADVNRQHREGNSPLHTVALSDIAKCLQNRSELARLLLKYGANRDLKNKAGQTAADIAKKQKRLALLEVLAEKFPPPPKLAPAPPAKPAAPPDREVDDLIAKMEARMRESAATERTEIQIPLAEPIVDEAITTTRVQPALGATLPGKLSIVCECGHRGNVKAEYAGRIVACPRCRRKIPVPG
jgi:Ankyrin repeats (3 copies)